MSAEEPKHPILDNEMKVNLPAERQVWIHDILSCKEGIHNNIRVTSRNEDIVIDSHVNQNGSNELKVYKNKQLVKHVVNGINQLDDRQPAKESPEPLKVSQPTAGHDGPHKAAVTSNQTNNKSK